MSEKHLSQMNKSELLLEAESIGLDVDPEATNAVLKNAVEAEQERLASLKPTDEEPAASASLPATLASESDIGEKMAAEVAKWPEPIIKSGGRKLRVRGFFGSFGRAVFMEDASNQYGVCDNVDDETLAALKRDFPGAEIEEIE